MVRKLKLIIVFSIITTGCRSLPTGDGHSPTMDKSPSQKLPLVFVVGDSISMHYGPYLQKMLAGSMAYQRKQAIPELAKTHPFLKSDNGGDSNCVLEYLRYMIVQKGFSPDYLVVNCGLHDLKVGKGQTAGVVSLEHYEANLRDIIALAKKHHLNIVWVRTTPVDDDKHAKREGISFNRYNRDVIAYNKVADRVFRENHCPIIDLNGFTSTLEGDIYLDGVHFIESVRQQQAAFIAGFLLALKQEQH